MQIQENYYGGGVKKLSRSQIKKMKENMQKVPLVQEKSDHYHRKEAKQAEELIQSIETSETLEQKINTKAHGKKKKRSLIEKIKNYLFG